jgi:hypothetical protein
MRSVLWTRCRSQVSGGLIITLLRGMLNVVFHVCKRVRLHLLFLTTENCKQCKELFVASSWLQGLQPI